MQQEPDISWILTSEAESNNIRKLNKILVTPKSRVVCEATVVVSGYGDLKVRKTQHLDKGIKYT
jgi:hypothetical protein